MTDQELLDGLRRGDRGAGGELMARFEGPLIRYLRAAMPTPEVAEDAAQEVFLRLITAVRKERTGGVRSLTALIFTIARHFAIDAGRQWSRRPRTLSLESSGDDAGPLSERVADDAADPREVAARHERDRQVQEALHELDEETREVITLRHIEGMSSREVAEILGVAEGTVWSRLHRGLERLKERLTPRTISTQTSKPRSHRP